VKADIYNLLVKHSCNKGRKWLEKHRSMPLTQVVEEFFADKIDFLRFVSFRVIGQKIMWDETVKNMAVLAIAKDFADPDQDIYSAKAVLEILVKNSHPEFFKLEEQ
jgi:hypothetical protein